jgi:hypothetical protein
VGGFIRDLDAPSPLPHCNLTTPHRRLVADLKNSASWVRRTLREGDERRQTRSEGAEHASSAGSPESEQIRDAHSETHVAQRGYNDGSTDCLSPVHRMTNPTIAALHRDLALLRNLGDPRRQRPAPRRGIAHGAGLVTWSRPP